MVQCEMCGAETPSPKTVKVEGAELQVCDECADFGTEVREESSSSTSTKYSTSSSSGSSESSQSSSSQSSNTRRRDMFDEMDEIAADYDERIRNARENTEMNQEELAKSIGEKASLIRKLERGDVLPTDDVQQKLESELGISLTESGDEEGEWSSDTAGSGLTLGDMVKRKD